MFSTLEKKIRPLYQNVNGLWDLYSYYYNWDQFWDTLNRLCMASNFDNTETKRRRKGIFFIWCTKTRMRQCWDSSSALWRPRHNWSFRYIFSRRVLHTKRKTAGRVRPLLLNLLVMFLLICIYCQLWPKWWQSSSH